MKKKVLRELREREGGMEGEGELLEKDQMIFPPSPCSA